MTTQTEYFKDIVGQKEALNQLSFYLDGHKTTKIFPSILITGSRGYGKTTLAKTIAKNLKKAGVPQHKKLISISGAEFQKGAPLTTFVDSVVIPHVVNDQEVTVFFDEIHQADAAVLNWLLPVLNPTSEYTNRASFQGMDFNFNFRYFTFLAATTNPEKLSKPLMDRMKVVDLQPYKACELIIILHRVLKDIVFKDNVEDQIVTCVRGNPRKLVDLAVQDIQLYLKQNNDKKEFGLDDWNKLKYMVGIKPLGLQNNEIEILRYLQTCGGCTLTQLAAKLSLDPSAVRRNYELFLLSRNLIRIDVKRFITPFGQEVLKGIDKQP